MITTVLQRLGWSVEHERRLPGRAPEFYSVADLPLRPEIRRLLSHYPQGIYCHQRLALQALLEGQDLCVATGTASGKSLVFYTAGIERLAADPGARILAIYPLKAILFLPPSLDKWLQKGHLVYFLSDAVDALDLSEIEQSYEKELRGQPPYPAMMVKVLLYAYCVGVYSSLFLQVLKVCK